MTLTHTDVDTIRENANKFFAEIIEDVKFDDDQIHEAKRTLLDTLKGEEKKKVARRIISSDLLWRRMWGQKKGDLFDETFGQGTLIYDDFCRMLTPDPVIKLYADDIINPMFSSHQTPLAAQYRDYHKRVFKILQEFMAVVQVARDTNTLEDKKKEYLYKYNDLLKALREEILLWAL